MRLNAIFAAAVALSFVPGLTAIAAAADAPTDAGGRFTISPVDGGFLRLDKQTGAVAMCAKSASDWACKPVEDDTANGPQGRLTRLESENKDLKARVKELEELIETHPPGPPPPIDGPLAGPPGGKAQLPTDAEVDQALDYLSRVYKKVREHIRDLDKPLPPDEHAEPPLLSPGPPSPPPAPPAPKGAL